jgi:hypothetical protein
MFEKLLVTCRHYIAQCHPRTEYHSCAHTLLQRMIRINFSGPAGCYKAGPDMNEKIRRDCRLGKVHATRASQEYIF